MRNSWKDLSIAKKLYAVFGVMAVLIAGELLTLRFAMGTLSAVRAFVGGEGSWSKAQKNAAFSLHRYGLTRDEADYQAFLSYLKVPEGDHVARLELQKKHPDLAVARAGFLAGNIQGGDITKMIDLLRRFYWAPYLSRAIEVWAEADGLLAMFRESGKEYHELLSSRVPDRARLEEALHSIRVLNNELTSVEDEFSRVLGEGSRWLERVIISLLFMAVLTAESVGLTLTFLTSRSISKGLSEISQAANAIGHGDFIRTAKVYSGDEIGQVATAVNRMGGLLEKSYRELEFRVRERTAELDKAVRVRDEFLSVASHELKTPLSSIKLQLQMRKKALDAGGESAIWSASEFRKMVADDEKQFDRLNRLIDDMLDVSRLTAGKFYLKPEPMELRALVQEVVDRFSIQARAGGSTLSLEAGAPVRGQWDWYRLEQVVTNLLTNAMKYGEGRPIQVTVKAEGQKAVLIVKDHGIGIAPSDQSRIFEQFERAVSPNEVSGLGLGLYITKQIVVAHGGSISVKSELGQGSEFRVEI